MKFETANEMISHIAYYNWKIWFEDTYPKPTLHLERPAINSLNDKYMDRLAFFTQIDISNMLFETDIYLIVFQHIMTAETHEVAEFFKFNDKRVCDPHTPSGFTAMKQAIKFAGEQMAPTVVPGSFANA